VANEAKPNALSRYISETRGELNKVTWPTRREALQLTYIVLGSMLVMGLYLSLSDFIGSWLIGFALGSN